MKTPSDNIFHKLRAVDPIFLLLITTIAVLGWVTLYSAAHGSISPWASRQIIRYGIGVLIFLSVAVVDLRLWLSASYTIYAVALVLLIGVEVMGFVGLGARRWIDLYIIQIQPSELMKVALVLVLARIIHDTPLQELNRLRTILKFAIVVILPVILVMRQPDLGTAMILLMLTAMMTFIGGVRLRYFLAAGAAGLTALPILWSFLHDYQRRRVLVFLNPESDPSGSGYHITQSKVALGSGGLWGKGFMQGTQAHLSFLPERQTDFIFTMFAEEMGLMGATVLLCLYAAVIFYGYWMAMRCTYLYARLVALGVISIFFLYVAINTGMVSGLLPVVGVPLPLFSYGGTSLLTIMIGFGLLQSASIHREKRLGD